MNKPSPIRIRALAAAAIGLSLAVRPGFADAASTPAIRDLAAQSDRNAVVLSWTLSLPTASTHFVIRIAEDGPAPSSPQTGNLVFEAQNLPEGKYRCRLGTLPADHRYSYTAFALDDAGAVLASSSTIGASADIQRPGPVQNLRRVDGQSLPGASSGGRGRR